MEYGAVFSCSCGQCTNRKVMGRFDRYDIICMCGKRMYPVVYIYDIHCAINNGKNTIKFIDGWINYYFNFKKPEYVRL